MGYLGSSATAGLCQALIAMQPSHDLYCETHLGGGALMQRKMPTLRSIGIDLDAQALAEFSCDYPVELMHGCAHEFLSSFKFQMDNFVCMQCPALSSSNAPLRAALPVWL